MTTNSIMGWTSWAACYEAGAHQDGGAPVNPAISWAGEAPVVSPARVIAAAPVTSGIIEVRRARLADAASVLALLDCYARRGLVLPRTFEQVCRTIREFVVAVDGHDVVGCAALRIHTPTLAEVAAVAVAEGVQGRGIGRSVVEAVVGEARELAIARVFAMTGQEPFFHRLGFRTVPLESIPEKIAADRAEGIDRSLHPRAAVLRELES